MSDKVCFSGGANGADYIWGEVSKLHGYRPVHFGFPGHRTRARLEESVLLDDEQLRYANRACSVAARSLRRSWPPENALTRKLLQRNFWQIQRTEAVYAVGWWRAKEDGLIAGGTSWAVQMYLDRRLPDVAVPVYFFTQEEGQWYTKPSGPNAPWVEIEKPPPPPNAFTGIGSRRLNDRGTRAIVEAFV